MWPQSRCARCRYRQEIRSKRGSIFWLCQRSKSEPTFSKYPPQPVLFCPGFAAFSPPEQAE
ncbi:MAG: hypothetical protein D6722_26245 [Bacteroidetes bacterium]|nr:MAG: hypothetical protein D6722_26245 [Bacteroidota bacterium]